MLIINGNRNPWLLLNIHNDLQSEWISLRSYAALNGLKTGNT